MKREVREKARELRRRGMSVGAIAKAVGASKGSVSVWVRDIELTEEQKAALKRCQHRWGAQNKGAQANRSKHLEKRKAYQEAGRARAREGSPLHLAGCMLYWAEGAKKRNHLYFVNSDSNMLQLFIRFLRDELKVDDSDIALYIHCHNADDIKRIQQYWTDVLQLPSSCLRKAQVKKGSDTRRNILTHGVCGIAVNRTELVMHIFGAIQEYGGFDNPDWLF
jgi:hypothetical protein